MVSFGFSKVPRLCRVRDGVLVVVHREERHGGHDPALQAEEQRLVRLPAGKPGQAHHARHVGQGERLGERPGGLPVEAGPPQPHLSLPVGELQELCRRRVQPDQLGGDGMRRGHSGRPAT